MSGISAINAPFVMIASMDVDSDHEEAFNDVYESEHIPFLSQVPGVLSIVRYTDAKLKMSIGGQVKRMPTVQPKYHALYAISDPSVLVSQAWSLAVEKGRWPAEVRPYTKNRRHVLLRIQ
jgi:hypothetical protein